MGKLERTINTVTRSRKRDERPPKPPVAETIAAKKASLYGPPSPKEAKAIPTAKETRRPRSQVSRKSTVSEKDRVAKTGQTPYAGAFPLTKTKARAAKNRFG